MFFLIKKNGGKKTPNLEEVFYSVLSKRKEYVEFWNFLHKMLSHGQATVERGFSVNKQVSGENLSRESIRALRLIIDTMRKQVDLWNLSLAMK